MWNVLVFIFSSVLLAGCIHECGHWGVARCLGHSLSFRLSGLRGVWTMPAGISARQAVMIAQAGFLAEFCTAFPILLLDELWGLIYLGVAVIHYAAYPYYAAGTSDFSFMTLPEED